MSASFKLSLPVDIPWRRKCVSEDMLDDKLCDKKAPLRWRSSLAVFEYEPEAEYQPYSDLTISYLKVVCSITGYQDDPTEIGLNARGLHQFWSPTSKGGFKDNDKGIEEYVSTLQKYYACYGAILEVSVGPSQQDIPLSQYPYILDFEPKKRELYELATDTRERQSRSIESLNITKSATNTQSLEVFDIDMGGGGMSQQASFLGTGGGFSVQNPNGQWGTKRLNADESLAARSLDVGQEKRETFSFSTQISQLHHLLDSYHLGTNRALFFVLPRPHTVQSEHTFVNGMRNIEGIQELFLIVARPKDTELPCVEVYLETGHIGKIPNWQEQEIEGTRKTVSWSGAYAARPLGNDDPTTVYDGADREWNVNKEHPGYRIVDQTFSTPNPRVDSPSLVDIMPHVSVWNADFIRVSGKVHSSFQNYAPGWEDRWWEVYYPFRVDIVIAKVKSVDVPKDTLFLTARSLCCCKRRLFVRSEGVVYERSLALEALRSADAERLPIVVANRMQSELKAAIYRSRTDLDNRYEKPVPLAYTNFAARALAHAVRADRLTVGDLRASLPGELSKKLADLNHDVTLHELLTMPVQAQRAVFGLSHEEVGELRVVLSGLRHGLGDDRRKAWLSPEDESRLFGKPNRKHERE